MTSEMLSQQRELNSSLFHLCEIQQRLLADLCAAIFPLLSPRDANELAVAQADAQKNLANLRQLQAQLEGLQDSIGQTLN